MKINARRRKTRH